MMGAKNLSGSEQLVRLTFSFLFVVMYASRVLVISQVIDSSLATIAIQGVYLLFVGAIWLVGLRSGRYKPTAFSAFMALMALHAFLFCYVFTNPAMPPDLWAGQTVGMFLLVILFTGWFVRSRGMSALFATLCFYALGSVLVLQLLQHPSDVNLSGLALLFSAEGRTRTVFGFGHANTLGGMCVTLFMMYLYRVAKGVTRRRFIMKCIDYALLTVTVIMLLCSASRSSLIGLALLLAFWALGSAAARTSNTRATNRAAAVLLVCAVTYVIYDFIASTSLEAALTQSNRVWLFEYAVPALVSSGRVMIGLGYVSNSAYGEGLTPYHTLWLDNGYVYYLVATGIIGLLIILSALCVLFGAALRYTNTNRDSRTHAYVMAVAITYVFIAFFEDMLLNGNPMNYFLIPLLLSMVPRNRTSRALSRRKLFQDWRGPSSNIEKGYRSDCGDIA